MKKPSFVMELIVLLACVNFLNSCATVRTNKEQSLTKKQIEAFRSAKTAKISVDQSYRGAKNKESNYAKLLLEDFVRKLMNIFGVQALSSDGKDYDLEIMIRITDFKPRSYTEKSWNEIAFFTGLISFEMSNIPVYSETFRADVFGSYETYLDLIKEYQQLFSQDLLSYQLMAGLEFRLPLILMNVFGASGVIESLKDEDKNVRVAAARMLSSSKDLRTLDPLIAALKDEDKDVRVIAANSICYLTDWRGEDFYSNNLKVADSLIVTLKDEDKNVRKAAAEALGCLKDPRAIEPLIEVLKDKDEDLKQSIEDALYWITGERFHGSHYAWLDWWKKNKDKFIKKD